MYKVIMIALSLSSGKNVSYLDHSRFFFCVSLCISNLIRFLRLNSSNNSISASLSAIFDSWEVKCAFALAILKFLLVLPQFTHIFLMFMLMLMSRCEPALKDFNDKDSFFKKFLSMTRLKFWILHLLFCGYSVVMYCISIILVNFLTEDL